MRPDHRLPSTLQALNPAEHTVLLTLRAIVTGQAARLGVTGVLKDVCGPAASETLGVMKVLVQRMALMARREIRMAPPGVAGLTRDEQQLICAFAAAQGNDFVRLQALLSFLLGRQPDAGFIAGFACVADAFARSQAWFRQPESSPPPRPVFYDPLSTLTRSAWRGQTR